MPAVKDPDQRRRVKALIELLRKMPGSDAFREFRKKFPPEPPLRPITLEELGIVRHEDDVGEKPSKFLLTKVRAKEKIIRAREKAQQERLSGKGVDDSTKSLNSIEPESNQPTKTAQKQDGKLSEKPPYPRWRDSSTASKLERVIDGIRRQGGERFALNLDEKRQAEAWERGIEPLRKRLSTILRRSLGHVPDFAMALDIDADRRIHVHGVIVRTAKTRAAVGRALRQAAGIWSGPAGNSHQLRYHKLDRPDWCAGYMLRNHDRLQQVQGQLIARTRPAISRGRARWNHQRAQKRLGRDNIVY
jgi:hypothetical protein